LGFWSLWFGRWGRRGASTAEYALILALVVIILIGTLTQLGQALTAKLQGIISEINNAR
jgi:pilus assembly protein Flp/PilA